MSYYVLSSYSEFLNLRCTCISTWSSRRQVRVQVRVPRAKYKYKYKYKYSPFKYKYEYKYSGFVLEYNSVSSTTSLVWLASGYIIVQRSVVTVTAFSGGGSINFANGGRQRITPVVVRRKCTQ